MNIKILAFGQIAELIGKSDWSVKEINNTDELRQTLAEQFPNLIDINYSIAVNKKIIQINTPLCFDDTVALLPQFSGG
ncbi:MAG: MoaD/ThiS family protein [Saprospiraceae bacterium]|jgi:molybdopterin synthase sulfur carrier subunit